MKILLAIDGSPCSDGAIAEVSRRPWPADTEVHVVTVDRPMDPGFLRGASATVFDEIVRQQRADAVKLVTDAVATLENRAPDLRANSIVLEGSAKDAILDEADRWGADLIVVGSHGYGSLRRLFLGSVSLAVAMGARCSVEIVRVPTASMGNTSTSPVSR